MNQNPFVVDLDDYEVDLDVRPVFVSPRDVIATLEVVSEDPNRCQSWNSSAIEQDIPGRGMTSATWNPIMIDEMVAKGQVKCASSIEGLAVEIGVPPNHLAGAVESYNAGAAIGDDDFAKATKFLAPIIRPPFIGAEVRPATVCFTACGLRIDADSRVLDDNGRVITGLLAGGECTGSVSAHRTTVRRWA